MVEIGTDSAQRLVTSIELALQTGVDAHARDLTPGMSSPAG
jgi:hypothetical protein